VNLVNFHHTYGMRLGIQQGDSVLDVTDACHELGLKAPKTLDELLADTESGLQGLRTVAAEVDPGGSFARDEAELQLGPAVVRPGKILCVGLNYRRHALEANMPIPDEPVLFGAFANAVSAPGAEIRVDGLEKLDYESELGVVIGRPISKASIDEARDAILGYFNANDLSDRELQLKSGQWFLGKSLDGFLPIGPSIRLADDQFDPDKLRIRGWLNGELRQDSSTSDMIFPVAELVAYTSRYISLEPGDIIITGTPEGVIMGEDNPRWMKPGDEFTVEIEGLGRLVNRLV
jgi:2-keto-4-pentenoate hydratase/2-oxohepta-3-ene-1,7-dioic acid hydratase in catechol pathway